MDSKVIQVLLVDDDPVFTLLACELLKSLEPEWSCRTRTLSDGETALKQVRSGRYDLALLDYNLPGANGLEILAEIRELPLARQPAVIMLTASGNESVAVEAMKRGARDYLTKANLDLPSLGRSVRSVLAQKRLAEQVEAYHSQLEADLDLARKLQQALLPHSYPAFPPGAAPEGSALRFKHRFFWTTELGGDFFSVQRLSPTRAGVFVCDVMGHGVRSALVTAMLRALVGDLAPHAAHPDRFLSEMNRRLTAILKETRETLFATAFYMVVEAADGVLRYARAGHPPPMHVRRREGLVEFLSFPEKAGPALGLFTNARYIACERQLGSGDLLLLFTDGLFEVTGPDDEEFGADRLLNIARQRITDGLEGMVDGVIDDVSRFCRGEPFEDDVCLLGVELQRLEGAASSSRSR